MVESLAEMMQRDWTLSNSETSDYNNVSTNNHSHLSRLLARKISDNTNTQHHPSTNDYNDASSSAAVHPAKSLGNRFSLDGSYDTDGALGTNWNRSKHHHHNSSNNYEHLISPRLPIRQNRGHSLKAIGTAPLPQKFSHKPHVTASSSPSVAHNHDDRDEDTNYEGDSHRRHIRLSRRVHQPTPTNGNHGARIARSAGLVQHASPFVATPSTQPLRIIFMRHSERANQALGADWFNKAFRTNTYKAYDQNLPIILPKRRFDQAYEFDAPLTVRGLKTARLTGRAMVTNNMTVDICLSSTALRCVQTCERILTGMDRRDRVPIRIEPGLFECPHYNHKIVDSFMTKKELMENRYNIKHDYKPIVSKVSVPETLEEYFERSATVMRGIIDRYGRYGGTVLIVSHAPGLLALTDAMKGLKTDTDTFYRNVSIFPPLTMYTAEYDGSKWRYPDQPFTLVLPTG